MNTKSREDEKSSFDNEMPIVAIGASAGGLESFEQFFDAMPDHSGIAFVIIQHLSPNFQSMMDELLARHSNMRIEHVIDGLRVEPNTIYLNPPRTEMTLKEGHFKLTQFSDDQLLNLPIDKFFESLAEEKLTKAVAIVLSGTGSDGTKGAGAIKKNGGIILAQDLVTAKFDGMPGSIIKKGYADAVGHPVALAEFVRQIMLGQPLETTKIDEFDRTPTEAIFRLLRERFGTEFHYYKKATILRRLERRAKLRNMHLEEYADCLKEDPNEVEALYADLLIEVTAFFRDSEAFEVLNTEVVPELAKRMTITRPIRIWIPGCASGEEAYSIAILFAEYAREHKLELNLKILATDIHHRSLDAASAGIYLKDSLVGMSDVQIDRYFVRDENNYQVKQHLRRMVVFSPHNVLKDPPFTRMDLVSCRNMLIYFNDIVQHKTLALFHFSLSKDSYLFLGPSESTGKLDNEFERITQRWRIFKKKRDVRLLEATTMLPQQTIGDGLFERSLVRGGVVSPSITPPLSGPIRQAHNEALKELLRLYAPPGFLLTKSGEIVHVFGDAGSLLRVESGVFSNRIVELVDDELKLIIGTAIERLKANNQTVFERRIASSNEELGEHSIVVILKHIIEPDSDIVHLLLTIERVPLNLRPATFANVKPLEASETTDILRGRISDLERDLRGTEESLQSTIEELETSNEELQATNEELMASNEELQSTNEELHSVNEELYTVSSEHQRKIDELTESNDDMDHLLQATNIGIIFLDNNLNIRRFTPAAEQVFNLIAQDVGRPIEHVTYKFEKLQLMDIIEQVRFSGEASEQEITIGTNTYVLRILPYRTSLKDVIGAVITSINISDIKDAENDRIQTTHKYETIVRDLTDFIVRWIPDSGEITYCNLPFADMFEKTVDDLIDANIYHLGLPGKADALFNQSTENGQDRTFDQIIFIQDSEGNDIFISGAIRSLYSIDGNLEAYQCTGRVVTENYRYRQALEELWKLQEEASDNEELPVTDILDLGCRFLGMRYGIVSQVVDNEYYIIDAVGSFNNKSQFRQVLRLNEIVCRNSLVNEGVFCIENWGTSNLEEQACYQEYCFDAYIGTTLSVPDGPVGTLSFYDKNARQVTFTEDQRIFVQLLSQSLSNLFNRQTYLKSIEAGRQYYQGLFNNAPIMMCAVNNKALVTDVNREWLSNLDFKREQVEGKDIRSFMSKDSKASLWKTFPKITNSRVGYRKRPISLVGQQNDHIDTELSAISHKKLETGDDQYVIVFEDVTDRNLAFSEVERQKNELQEANEGLNTFAYVASHDLQEPLRKITQFTEMLSEEYSGNFDEEGEYFLQIITSSAYRISTLVRDILEYSMTSTAEIQLEEVDLHGILEMAKNNLTDTIQNSDAVITIESLPSVLADAATLRQLCENLLSNAIKYNAPDTTPNIVVSSRHSRCKTIFEVADNGIGLDRNARNKIFTPFVRLHDKYDYPGSGLGLAICKIICDRLGWKISYRKNQPSGTIFSISIPDKVLFD